MIHRGIFWTTGGIEVALLMGLVTLAFVIGGGGRYSVDRLIGREF
jgi:putative oxidoreductase